MGIVEDYKSTLDKMLEGCQLIGPDWRYLYVNEAVAKHGRYTKEKLLGHTMMEMYPGIENTKMFAALRDCMKKHTIHHMENEFVFPDGYKGWFELSFLPVPEGIFILSLDITEKKQAAEERRQSEEKLDAMLKSIGDHMSMTDKDLNIIWANETAKRVFGNDIIGKKCYEVYHGSKEPCEPLLCSTVKAFQDGKVHEHDTQVVDKDGGIRYFHCTNNVALRDKEGKPTAVIEISRDITESRQREQEVLNQKRELEAISQLTKVISSNLNINEIFEFFAQQLKELVNFDRLSISLIEEDKVRLMAVSSKVETELRIDAIYPLETSATGWTAKHKTTLIEPDLSRHRLFPYDDISFKAGLRSSIHLPLFSKREAFGSLNLASFKPNAYGEKEQAIMEQLTAQIACAIQNASLYSQDRAYREEMKRREKERIEFSKAVAHELKTPLTSIIAAAELLGENIQKEGAEPEQKLVQNIVHSARSLETNLNELLESTKTGTALGLQIMPLDTKKLLNRVTESFSPVAKRKGQSLVADLPDSLPIINADAQRLEQVIRNLLMNAIKFTPDGGSITLRANKHNSNLVVEVQDNGIGIHKEEQDKLFEPYYRVEADRQRFSGMGLGLALSKHIIELHRGRIWVTSELGKGSIFAFSLPL